MEDTVDVEGLGLFDLRKSKQVSEETYNEIERRENKKRSLMRELQVPTSSVSSLARFPVRRLGRLVFRPVPPRHASRPPNTTSVSLPSARAGAQGSAATGVQDGKLQRRDGHRRVQARPAPGAPQRAPGLAQVPPGRPGAAGQGPADLRAHFHQMYACFSPASTAVLSLGSDPPFLVPHFRAAH
jgi:hypothetical protein